MLSAGGEPRGELVGGMVCVPLLSLLGNLD